MRTRQSTCFKIFFILFLTLGALQAEEALFLYKSSEEKDPKTSRLANNVGPILKNLGWTISYHDVDGGLPNEVNADLLATWYNTPKIASPEAYVDWMAARLSEGKKVVVLGNFGAHTADGETWMTNESLNRFFQPFGLKYGAAYTGDASVIKVTRSEPPAKTPDPANFYLQFSSVNPANNVYLQLERTDLANSRSAMVVQTPQGGMAQELYVNTLDLKEFITRIAKAEKQAPAARKKLLGLYKSSENVDARSNFIARFVTPTLFDLGYSVDYHDIESGLPTADRMKQYEGVISWYNTPELSKAGDYVDWLATQVEADRRIVILGNFGAFAEDIDSKAGVVTRFLQSPEYNRFFYPFGLEFRGAWTPEKKAVQVVEKDQSVMTWLEPGHVGHYYWIRSVHPDNEEYLTVTRSDLQDGESAVVVATPHGGLALESYVLSTDPETKQPRFHLDLEKFLRASLTLKATTAQTESKTDELKAKPALSAIPSPTLGGEKNFPAGVTPVKRRILAFYHSSAGEAPKQNQTFNSGQMVLEHLGLIVDYHDLDSGTLPSMKEMENYRGILLWLSEESVPNALEFDTWLQQNVVEGRKLALIGDYVLRDKETFSLVNPAKLYAAMGVFFDPVGNIPQIQNRKGVRELTRVPPREPSVLYKNEKMLDFEAPIDFTQRDLKSGWHLLKSALPEAEVHLRVTHEAGPSDLLIVNKTGGIAAGPFAMFNRGRERSRQYESISRENAKKAVAEDFGGDPWRINPYRFFTQAFKLEGLPMMDFTTLNGSRIYYSHIDGDAFGGISLIDRSSINGEMMKKRVLDKLPLPITVSYVTKDVESRLDERYSRELGVAQEIFKLPNVEAASHTYSHPFDWKRGDLALSSTTDEKYELVRKDIDLEKEILHSLDFVDKLCPPDKRCEILLWSGRCNPKPRAIELVRSQGLPNMNGAEPTLDEKRPYIAGVLPLFGIMNGEVQYHVSAAGDFFYTSSWTRDYDGMKNVEEFFERTESPRRLRCMNVYYHFYLAERELGIEGLDAAYAAVLEREPAPMFASQYAAVLRDYLETSVGVDTAGHYYIRNHGLDRTVRFDNESRYPDLNSSEGVVGFHRLNNALYLHLDGSGAAKIVLTEQEPNQPYLSRFSHRFKNWSISSERIKFTALGQGPAHLTLSNLVPSSDYRIETDSGETTVRTDARGVLSWEGRFDGYRGEHPVNIRKATP